MQPNTNGERNRNSSIISYIFAFYVYILSHDGSFTARREVGIRGAGILRAVYFFII